MIESHTTASIVSSKHADGGYFDSFVITSTLHTVDLAAFNNACIHGKRTPQRDISSKDRRSGGVRVPQEQLIGLLASNELRGAVL
jgi:hypothetical protein